MRADGSERIEVLICTYGADGMHRLATAGVFPPAEGVDYVVSWQLPDGDADVPRSIASRPDFRVVKTCSYGLSVNRNHALDIATAPICLIADDDLVYDPAAFENLREAYRHNPAADMILSHITADGRKTANYFPSMFDLRKAPRGYYYVSVEISFRLEAVRRSGVRFNEMMGIGAPVLRGGEEEIFMRSLLRKGLRGICIPLVIGNHIGPSTGKRMCREPWFIMTQGAVARFRHPRTWMTAIPYRALVATRRYGRNIFANMRLLWQGAMYSRRTGMFKNI